MKFFVLTIFPQMIEDYCKYGIVRKAIKVGALEVFPINLRDFAPKGQVDDTPYGGFPGMVIKPEPIFEAHHYVTQNWGKPYVLLPQPWGKKISQKDLDRWANMENLMVICGRYEGVDERVTALVDEEISLGDFVLAGGELVAMVILEGVARLLPGVLNDPESLRRDSFRRWLGAPVYTRPPEYMGMKVPSVLISGHHQLIELWALWHSIERTLKYRPDLVPSDLSPLEKDMLESIRKGMSFEEWLKTKNKSHENTVG